MKTRLTLILILLSILTFGQNSYQITDTTKEWNTILIGSSGWNVMECAGTRTNKVLEEAQYNDSTFFKVFESYDSLQQDWEEVGYLRENILTKKVYYASPNFNEIGLLYDFDLQVGDSVIIDNYYVGFEDVIYYCDSINTITINGSEKNRFFFHSNFKSGNCDTWIEGIGSIYGLLYSGFQGAGYGGGYQLLLCCSKDENVIYMDSVFNTCYIREFYPQIASEYYDTAYLDKPYEFQLELSHTDNVDSFALIADVIPEDFEFDITTGLLTGLPTSTGSFTCIITVVNYDYGYLLTDILYSEIVVVLPTEINIPQNKNEISVAPNPIKTHFSISYSGELEKPYCLEIINCEGRVIDTKTVSETDYKIDCSQYKKGVYLLKITGLDERDMVIKKIVKK